MKPFCLLAIAVLAGDAGVRAGDCFAFMDNYQEHKWIHINTKCSTTDDCRNVCDCDAVCIDTAGGCGLNLPPRSGIANTTSMAVVCPYLHDHDSGDKCSVCPAGSKQEGTCSSNCTPPALAGVREPRGAGISAGLRGGRREGPPQCVAANGSCLGEACCAGLKCEDCGGWKRKVCV